MQMQTKYKPQLALITGASSGLGETLAYLLDSKQIALILCGRHQERLNAVASRCCLTVPPITVIADLATPEGVQTVVAAIAQYTPDLVINNAGVGLYGDVLSHPAADQLHMIDLDVKSVLELTLATAVALKVANRPGVILNVSSVAGCFPYYPGLTVYSASKACVNSFSQALDVEFKRSNIRVLVACPGQIATQFRSTASKGRSTQSPGNRGVMDADFAAREIWWQIQKQRRLHVFDWRYRWGLALTRLLPRSWVSSMLRRNIEKFVS